MIRNVGIPIDLTEKNKFKNKFARSEKHSVDQAASMWTNRTEAWG